MGRNPVSRARIMPIESAREEYRSTASFSCRPRTEVSQQWPMPLIERAWFIHEGVTSDSAGVRTTLCLKSVAASSHAATSPGGVVMGVKGDEPDAHHPG